MMTETFACKIPGPGKGDAEDGAPVFNPTRPTPTQTAAGLVRLQPFIAQPHPLVRPGSPLALSAQQLLSSAIKRARRTDGLFFPSLPFHLFMMLLSKQQEMKRVKDQTRGTRCVRCAGQSTCARTGVRRTA